MTRPDFASYAAAVTEAAIDRSIAVTVQPRANHLRFLFSYRERRAHRFTVPKAILDARGYEREAAHALIADIALELGVELREVA